MEEIEADLSKELDKIISGIDIDTAIDAPEVEMMLVARKIEDLLIEKYFQKAIEQGVHFAKEVRKSKEIIIADSTNPTLNEGIVT